MPAISLSNQAKLTQDLLKELFFLNGDNELVWKVSRGSVKAGSVAGYLDNNGYRAIKIKGKNYLAHRLIWFHVHGEWPNGEIDHEKHNRNDNRIKKLRVVTHAEQMKNASLRKDSTSGHTGVNWDKGTSKWRAQIMANGKNKHLGLFDNINDAIEARAAANIKYGFHMNHGLAVS